MKGMFVVCFLKKNFKFLFSVAVRTLHGVSGDHWAPHDRDEVSAWHVRIGLRSTQPHVPKGANWTCRSGITRHFSCSTSGYRRRAECVKSLLMCWTGSKSGPGSIPAEASWRRWTGDARKPFGYKGPDSESSQVHDSQFTVWRTGLYDAKIGQSECSKRWWDHSESFVCRWMRF